MNLTLIILFVCIVLVFIYTLYVDYKTQHLDFLNEFSEKHNTICKEMETVKNAMVEISEKHNFLITVVGLIDKRKETVIKKHNIMAEDLATLTIKYNKLIEALKEIYNEGEEND